MNASLTSVTSILYLSWRLDSHILPIFTTPLQVASVCSFCLLCTSTSPCNTLYVISLSKEFSHSVRQLLSFFSSSQMDCMIPFSVGKYSRSSERRIGSHGSSMSVSVVVSQSHSSARSADMMDSARSYLRQPLFLRLDPSLSLFQGFLSCILASIPHIISCYVFTRPTSSAFGRAIMYSC